VPLHCGPGLRVDPGQRLAGIDDREQGLVGLPVQAVAFHDFERLPRQKQFVVAPVLGVPQHDLATLEVDIADLDRRVEMALAAMYLDATAAGDVPIAVERGRMTAPHS
jgi:hypothetical protein